PAPTDAIRGVVRGHVVAPVRVLCERLANPWTAISLAEGVNPSRSQLVSAFDAPRALVRRDGISWLWRLVFGRSPDLDDILGRRLAEGGPAHPVGAAEELPLLALLEGHSQLLGPARLHK